MKFLPIDLLYLIALGAVIGVLAELYTRYVLAMQRQGNRWFGDRLILRMTLSGLILGCVYQKKENAEVEKKAEVVHEKVISDAHAHQKSAKCCTAVAVSLLSCAGNKICGSIYGVRFN